MEMSFCKTEAQSFRYILYLFIKGGPHPSRKKNDNTE